MWLSPFCGYATLVITISMLIDDHSQCYLIKNIKKKHSASRTGVLRFAPGHASSPSSKKTMLGYASKG